MASDPHARTNKLFTELVGKAGSPDVKLLLEGIQWLCTLVEEVTIGQQQQVDQFGGQLTRLEDQLDTLKAAVKDLGVSNR